MFNPLDYKDHIDYCEYVYNKNNELNLGLTSSQEIQFLANKYFNELCARRGEVDELIENDKLLEETLKKQSKMFKKFRPIEKQMEIKANFEQTEQTEKVYEDNQNISKTR